MQQSGMDPLIVLAIIFGLFTILVIICVCIRSLKEDTTAIIIPHATPVEGDAATTPDAPQAFVILERTSKPNDALAGIGYMIQFIGVTLMVIGIFDWLLTEFRVVDLSGLEYGPIIFAVSGSIAYTIGKWITLTYYSKRRQQTTRESAEEASRPT